jgi:hypothetical protein
MFGNLVSILADTYVRTGPFWGYGFTEVLVGLIILAGIASVFFIILKKMEVQIPPYILHILGIIFLVVVGVLAIRFLASMW